MTPQVRGAVLIATAVTAARVVVAGEHTSYVRPSFGPWLLLVCAIMLGLGSVELTGRAGGRVSPVAGMLLVPTLLLTLVAPGPLGVYTAGRSSSAPLAQDERRPAGDGAWDEYLWPELPAPVGGAVDLPIGTAAGRAVDGEPGGIVGTPVRLVGFVVTDPDVDGYLLTRMTIACCAADAMKMQVVVTGAAQPPQEGSWVELIARFDGDVLPGERFGMAWDMPVFTIVGQTVITQPDDPYDVIRP